MLRRLPNPLKRFTLSALSSSNANINIFKSNFSQLSETTNTQAIQNSLNRPSEEIQKQQKDIFKLLLKFSRGVPQKKEDLKEIKNWKILSLTLDKEIKNWKILSLTLDIIEEKYQISQRYYSLSFLLANLSTEIFKNATEILSFYAKVKALDEKFFETVKDSYFLRVNWSNFIKSKEDLLNVINFLNDQNSKIVELEEIINSAEWDKYNLTMDEVFLITEKLISLSDSLQPSLLQLPTHKDLALLALRKMYLGNTIPDLAALKTLLNHSGAAKYIFNFEIPNLIKTISYLFKFADDLQFVISDLPASQQNYFSDQVAKHAPDLKLDFSSRETFNKSFFRDQYLRNFGPSKYLVYDTTNPYLKFASTVWDRVQDIKDLGESCHLKLKR